MQAAAVNAAAIRPAGSAKCARYVRGRVAPAQLGGPRDCPGPRHVSPPRSARSPIPKAAVNGWRQRLRSVRSSKGTSGLRLGINQAVACPDQAVRAEGVSWRGAGPPPVGALQARRGGIGLPRLPAAPSAPTARRRDMAIGISTSYCPLDAAVQAWLSCPRQLVRGEPLGRAHFELNDRSRSTATS
jgi:hypothetical protein